MYEEKLKQLDLFSCDERDMGRPQTSLATCRSIIEKAEPDSSQVCGEGAMVVVPSCNSEVSVGYKGKIIHSGSG